MKKQVLTVGTAILFMAGSATFVGCGNAETPEKENHEHADGHDHAAGEEHGEEKEEHGGHDHSDGHAHEHGATSESKVAIDSEFSGEKVANLSMIIDGYLELKNALAKDDSEAGAVASNKMLTAFNGFDASGITGEDATEYAEIAESAVENGEHIVKNAGILDHQREHLVSLSEDMNDLIALVGTDKKLYQDFCPMANNNKGAIWISETEDINNPYMGTKMPTCGKIQKEIN